MRVSLRAAAATVTLTDNIASSVHTCTVVFIFYWNLDLIRL